MTLPFPNPRNHYEETANARAMDGDYSTGPWKHPAPKRAKKWPLLASGIFYLAATALLWLGVAVFIMWLFR